jgi:hypothetical protein
MILRSEPLKYSLETLESKNTIQNLHNPLNDNDLIELQERRVNRK